MTALSVMMCISLAACGSGGDKKEKTSKEETTETKEEKKTYDATDESGIINCDLVDRFVRMDNTSLTDDTSLVQLRMDSHKDDWTPVEINVMVRCQAIYDYSAEVEADTLLSYIYAEDPVKEEVEMFGMKGYKVAYHNTEYNDDKQFKAYVLTHPLDDNEENMGYLIVARAAYYPEDEEYIDQQFEKLEFDWDAYEFPIMQKDSEEEETEAEETK